MPLDTGPNRRALIDDASFGRPHVVILGAGASRAAFPQGDSGGHRLPVMDDLVEVLQLETELSASGIEWEGGNFEELYSRLSLGGARSELTATIETRVREYFTCLRLPASTTLYDYLVLSLRSKDVIASFNWDPLLFDACRRNADVGPMPLTLFLHGNVRAGYCPDDLVTGDPSSRCPSCDRPFRPSKLMFPVSEKDYAKDPYLATSWEAMRRALRAAYVLTIFGYSAPQSDVEAIALMKAAWGPVPNRNLEQIEIIDIRSPNELRETWQSFIHTHHDFVRSDWQDSLAASYPRRTCEAVWSQFMEGNIPRPAPIPEGLSLGQLREWVAPLVAAEVTQDGADR